MLFDNRSVYLGASKEKYEQYCKALEAERIKYKTNRINHEEKMAAPGRGTLRGMGGNSGTDKTCTKSWSEGKTTIMQWEF